MDQTDNGGTAHQEPVLIASPASMPTYSGPSGCGSVQFLQLALESRIG